MWLLSSMAPVLSSPPSRPCSPSRLRPPPDPPPCWSLIVSLVSLEALSPVEPPEPPDPPDALLFVLSDSPFTPSLKPLSQTPASLTSDDWYEMIVVWVSPNIWIIVLNCNIPIIFGLFGYAAYGVRISTALCSFSMVLTCTVPMTFGLFGTDLLPACGCLVAFVRILTTVCSLSMVFNLDISAVSLCFPSWWQFERRRFVWFLQLNMIMLGFHYPVASFVKLFLFLIFPPMWSELDVQVSPVLQGASSWLMLFSAFVAVFVTLQVTRYAFIQEGYEIVVFRFLMFSCNDMYRHSILCLINVLVYVALSGFVVFSFVELEIF